VHEAFHQETTERSTIRRRTKPRMVYTLFTTATTTTTTEALVFSIPYSHHNQYKQLHWFSNTLQYYICRKSHFYCHCKKIQSLDAYSVFSYFCKLGQATTQSDRRRWLKSVYDNLKTQPTEFWKYVSIFKRKDNLISYT